MILISRRVQDYAHSQYRQITSVRKRHPHPTVLLKPAKAKGLGIMDGDWIWVETQMGRAKFKCQYSEGMLADVVSVELAWWFPEDPDDEGRAQGVLQMYSDLNPRSVPKGKQLLYQMNFLYKAPKDFKVAERYATDVVLPHMRKWLEDFDENVEWCMISISPVVYAEIDQQIYSNSETFDVKTGVQNLYFAGMHTGYIGVEGAMLSGVKAAEQILGHTLL